MLIIAAFALDGCTAMRCSAPFALPSKTAGSTDTNCTSVGPNSVPLRDGDPQPYQFRLPNTSCTSRPLPKQLPGGSKVNYDAKLIACIDDKKHGFVLQPSRS
jgi:hypothetical protein